jgi:hypothetical protein
MPCAAENDPSIAAVGKPATITARTASPDETAAAPSRLVVSVSDFQPAADGNAVQVVVRALNERTGAEQEVGRFGVMPYGAAGCASPAQPNSFGRERDIVHNTKIPDLLILYRRPSGCPWR